MRNFYPSAAAISMAFALSACAGNGATPATGAQPSNLEAFIRSDSHRIEVKPGQSIQAAVDSASPGDTVVVQPGNYREAGRPCPFKTNEICAVSITKNDISLVGLSGSTPVVLLNPKGQSIGIGIGKYYQCNSSYRIDGNRVVGFTVTGFKDTGIELTCVKNWEWAFDTVTKDTIYGFYPVFASNGRLDNSIASGATDTGFYVGISDHIRVDHNVAFNNVSGYEFENTIESKMDHNTAYNNTGGILEFIIPGDPMERSYNNLISDNVVTQNNNANKCTRGVVCTVPPGTGILDIGGTNNRFARNNVSLNKSFGIALTDVCMAFNLKPGQCKKLKYDPLPERNRFEGNTVLYNGLDLAWVPQSGKGNCWSGNRAKTKNPSPLPSCAAAAAK
jgi:parallel beta-helix repeat protein